MALSKGQQIGVGALMGGVATVGMSMLLRYYADNKGKASGEGKPVDYPVTWEHAPLVGILGGAAATALAYYLWGTDAAVAAGITALIAGVAPEADAWVTDARSEKDLNAKENGDENGNGNGADGLRGSDAEHLRARVASLEAELEAMRRAA